MDDLARMFNAVHARVGEQAFAPVARAYGRGYIANVSGNKASVRKDLVTAEPTPGFDVPPSIEPREGDYFLFYELGSQRVLLHPLDRNAATNWNPLTAAGQMIFAGDDGRPAVIEAPADPTLRHQLRWGGDTHQPSWQDASIDPAPPPDEPPPTPPPVPPIPPPTDWTFPPMTMWWPYWKGRSVSAVSAVVADLVYMQQDGVVLMGMEWGSQYALPADVSAKLDLFIGAGIKPYLGLWVGHLTDADRTTGQRAFDAGEGKWAGIVLDAESQWVKHCKPADQGGVGPAQAKADFDGFMDIFRPLAGQLAVACYAAPTSFPNYHYDWWNEVIDTFLPLAYFNSVGDTAELILNTMYRKFGDVDFTHDCKPIVPVMAGYKSTLSDAAVAARKDYIDLALANAGAVHIWRWIDDFPDNMRAMLHSYGS